MNRDWIVIEENQSKGVFNTALFVRNIKAYLNADCEALEWWGEIGDTEEVRGIETPSPWEELAFNSEHASTNMKAYHYSDLIW